MGAQIPREPRPGDRLDAALIIQIIRFVRDLDRRLNNLRPREGGRRGSGASGLTLYVSDASTLEAGAQVSVSVGRIANLPLTIEGTELGAIPAPVLPITTSGVVYIRGSFDEDGLPESFEILNAAEVPDDTLTEGHKILAEVTFDEESGEITALNPVVWNLSEVQKCGSLVYLWGGFGG